MEQVAKLKKEIATKNQEWHSLGCKHAASIYLKVSTTRYKKRNFNFNFIFQNLGRVLTVSSGKQMRVDLGDEQVEQDEPPQKSAKLIVPGKFLLTFKII